MAIKLKLRLPIPQSVLLLKAILFGALLWFAKAQGLGFFSTSLFVALALALYMRPAFRPFQFAASWGALIILSLGMAGVFSRALLFVPAIVISSILFAILLGVKDVQVIHRKEWHSILHLGFVYELFIIFFLREEVWPSSLLSLGVFGILFLLMREYVTINERNIIPTPSLRASVAGALSLIMIETLVVIRLLPLGFINAANMAFLVFFVMQSIMLRSFEKTLTKRSALTILSLFLALLSIVLFTSRWSI